MADTYRGQQNQQDAANQSAVINLDDVEEMETMDQDDLSDYESSFSGPPKKSGDKAEGIREDIRQRIGENVTAMFWQAGKQQATKAWSLYGNIDILRPYFNVEPHEVRARLISSFVPQKPSTEKQRAVRELYGPLMVIFTLIALLLFQMKTAEHRVEEGTLMGTAFGVCFTYWLGGSGFVWFLCFVCNTRLSFLQISSMMGYALFGHCVVLFLGTVIHTSHDHLFFYLLWAVIGGLTTLKMVGIVLSRTHGQTQRLIVCGSIAALHLLFLLYLHFAYHQIVEEISEVFDNSAVKVPIGQANSVLDNTKDLSNSAARVGKPAINSTIQHVMNRVVTGLPNLAKTLNKSFSH